MTFSIEEVQRLIELGAKGEFIYKTSINGTPVKLKWRPLYTHENSIVISDSLDLIPDYVRNWLVSKQEDRDKMEAQGIKIPASTVRKFNHILAIQSIYYAMKDFYQGLTTDHIGKMDIDHIAFHRVISTGSGDTDGEDTVNSFPVESTT